MRACGRRGTNKASRDEVAIADEGYAVMRICDFKGEVPPASSFAPVLANQYPTHNHIVCVALLQTGDAVVVPNASRGVDTVVLGNGDAPTSTNTGRGIEAPTIGGIGREKMHWVVKMEDKPRAL